MIISIAHYIRPMIRRGHGHHLEMEALQRERSFQAAGRALLVGCPASNNIAEQAGSSLAAAAAPRLLHKELLVLLGPNPKPPLSPEPQLL